VLTIPQRLYRSALGGLLITGLSWILYHYVPKRGHIVVLKPSTVVLMFSLNFLITCAFFYLLTIPRIGKGFFLMVNTISSKDGPKGKLTSWQRLLISFESGLTWAALFSLYKLPQLEASQDLPEFIINFCVMLCVSSILSYIVFRCADN